MIKTEFQGLSCHGQERLEHNGIAAQMHYCLFTIVQAKSKQAILA